MKITVLIENTCPDKNLLKEHGLSLLLETNGQTLLFDAGQSGEFATNAKNLGINLNTVDTAILSHGHYDHGNGLIRFLKENDHAPIYMNTNAFEGHYYKNERDIGLNKALADSSRIHFTGDDFKITDNITLSTNNGKPKVYETDPFNLTYLEDGTYKPENFKHEHYLLIKEKGKKILLSGCSHKGIENIVNWYKPDVLIGGFHLMDLKMDENGKDRLRNLAEELKGYNTLYYTCHCTGKEQFKFLKELMGERLKYLSTGDTIII